MRQKILSMFIIVALIFTSIPAITFANETKLIHTTYLTYEIYLYNDSARVYARENVELPEHLEIPSQINGYSVDEVASKAFEGHEELKTITLPEGITIIDPNAFANCTSLETVVLPSTLKVINDNAFQCCENLKSIYIPNGVYSIGDNAFDNCYSLKSISLPDSIEYLGEYTFADCISLEKIKIPKGVSEIPSRMFARCETLNQVELPKDDKVRTIKDYAFLICYDLKHIYIPPNYILEEEAFDGCFITLHGEKGSSAEEYCNEYELSDDPFAPIPYEFAEFAEGNATVYKDIESVETGLEGGDMSFDLFVEKSGSADIEEQAKIMPTEFDFSVPAIDAHVQRRNEDDGTYTYRIGFGIDKDKIGNFFNDNKWDSFAHEMEKAASAIDEINAADEYNILFDKYGKNQKKMVLSRKFNIEPEILPLGFYEIVFDEKGKVLDSNGLLILYNTLDASYTMQCIYPIPYYTEVGVNMENKIDIDIINNLEFMLGTETTIAPSLFAGAGVGANNVLCVGSRGYAGLEIQLLDSLENSFESKGSFSLKASLKYNILSLFEDEYEFYSRKMPIWGNDKAKNLTIPSTASSSKTEFKLSDRAYQSETTAWNGTIDNSDIISSNSRIKEVTLQGNIYPNTAAEILHYADDSILLFNTNDPSRDTVNSVKLMYSIKEGNSWSEPVAVFDNGTLDLSYDVQVDNNDLYIVWQKSKEMIEGSSFDEFNKSVSNNAEIYVSKYNYDTKEFENPYAITDNTEYDSNPTLTIDSSSSTVVWCSNESDDILDVYGKKTFKSYDLESESGESVLGSTTDYVTELKAYELYDGIEVVYLATDGESQKLCLLKDGVVNTLETFDLNNIAAGLDYENGTVSYTCGGKVYKYDVYYSEKDSVVHENVNNISSNAQVVMDQDSISNLVWMVNRDDGCSIYACQSDWEDYGEAIELYHSSDMVGNSFSVAINKNNTWEIVLNASDINDTENHSLIYIEKDRFPKLELEAITVNEAELDYDKKIQPFTFIVKNNGDETINDFTLYIKPSNTELIEVNTECNLKPGESVSYDGELSLDEIGASKEIEFQVLAKGQTDEAGTSVIKSYVPGDFRVSVTKNIIDEAVEFNVTIKNTGLISGDGTVTLYNGIDSSDKIMSEEINILEPGKETIVKLIYPVKDNGLTEDKECHIEFDSSIDEYSIENNEYVGVIYQWEFLKDLSLYSIDDFESTYIYTGQAITPKVEISGLKEGTDYTVSYTDNTEPGIAALIVTGTGQYTGSFEVPFAIENGKIEGISVKNYKGAYDGKAHTISLSNMPEGATVTYSTEENGIYTETKPTRTNVGTTIVYFTVSKAGYEPYLGTGEIIISALKLSGITAKGYKGSYDGKAHTITLLNIPSGAKVTYATSKNGTYTAKKPTRTNAGTTTVYFKVTKPNYETCSGSKDISITKAAANTTSVKLSSASYVYSGKVRKPTVKVYNNKGKQISASNYTVKYAAGRKNVGKYKVIVTFKNNYKGKKNLYFKINPKGTTINKLTSSKKAFTVKWNKKTVQITGYQLRYSVSSNMKNSKTKTIKSSKTTSKKITKLKANKKYYVQVRTYKTVKGIKYYSSWSKAKVVKTK